MKTLTRLLAAFAVALLFLPACNKDKPKPLDQSFQPETVDMGGSVLWASFNLGATDRLEMGLELAWGEWAERDDGHQQYYRFYDEAYYENHFEYTAYNTEDGQTTLLPSDSSGWLTIQPPKASSPTMTARSASSSPARLTETSSIFRFTTRLRPRLAACCPASPPITPPPASIRLRRPRTSPCTSATPASMRPCSNSRSSSVSRRNTNATSDSTSAR